MASWIALLALLLVHEATSFNLHSGWTLETAAGPDRLVALHIFVKHAPGATESLRHRLHGNSDPFSPTTYAEKRGRERENVCARAREGLFMCPYSLALPCTNQYCIPRTLSCTMYAHTHTRHIVRTTPSFPLLLPGTATTCPSTNPTISCVRFRNPHKPCRPGSPTPASRGLAATRQVGEASRGEGRGMGRGARCPPTSVCIESAEARGAVPAHICVHWNCLVLLLPLHF